MERTIKYFLPGTDFVGLKTIKGEVSIIPNKYTYIWYLQNDYYLVLAFCFYGIVKKVQINNMVSFAIIVPPKYHWIKCLPNDIFEGRIGGVHHQYDSNGTFLKKS